MGAWKVGTTESPGYFSAALSTLPKIHLIFTFPFRLQDLEFPLMQEERKVCSFRDILFMSLWEKGELPISQ